MKPRVLVVDDDPQFRELVRGWLEADAIEVHEAGGAQEALARVEATPPDLLCLDLMLPELGGFEVCERIRRIPSLARLPILVVSARDLPADRALAEELGASAYLIKPVAATAFLEQVRALLAHRAATRAL